MNSKSFFKKRLESTFCADCFVDWQSLKASLRNSDFPNRESEFKKELAEAIIDGTISLEEFENLTNIDFDTQQDVAEFLKTEIWQPLYGDEPITI